MSNTTTTSPTAVRGGQIAFLLIVLAIFVAIAARFTPFLSAYGDVQVYIHANGFDLHYYQPAWPYFATSIYQRAGIGGLFYLQATLYFLSILLIFGAAARSGKYAAGILAIFLALNIRAYFYVANPLTEIFNIFLFSLGLLCWTGFQNGSTLFRAIFCIVLIAIGFARSANVLFIALLLCLSAFHAIRRARESLVPQLVAILPALLVVVIFNLSVQSHTNNTGVNLLRFVLSACEPDRCSADVFVSPQAPHVTRYYEQHHSLAAVDNFFSTENIDMFSPQLTREMKAIYLNLLLKNPRQFFDQVLRNYEQQVADTYLPPYPEDPNTSIVASQPFAAANTVTTTISQFIAKIAPLLFIGYLAQLVFARSIDHSVSYLLAWLFAEVATSQMLFSNLWVSDASRMRFHYEIPGLLLALLLVAGWRRWRGPRTGPGTPL